MKNARPLIGTLFLTLWTIGNVFGAELSENGRSFARRHVSAAGGAIEACRSARAAAVLGFRHEHGFNVPQSYEIAAAYYHTAAACGDPTGQYLFGLSYDKGHGVAQDGVLAYMWLNLAAAHAPQLRRPYYLRTRDAVANNLTPAQLSQAQWLAIQWRPGTAP
ncbi:MULTISPECIES: SEL1-like repeat protein [Bradyrhizobium]|uniref:Sel1 repeat family protein n=3 Tax=Bradyrhizobium TaxID=374 RepID=A0A410VIG7_9BRAD|nr:MULTISPECIES: SEL1-like repeat protein [Bradyrhizobium]MCG2628158.1 SEL1-like repeat protein [Bradyrhizobium zhengyangense]MCG2643277.1 SEL1-like repeat protein [Bradyrhizobium zhengyangense]MCG2670409.1 SEL1-like repeat protein [Bradyrhizobium zhengyangense]MDN4985856.1 SEL1-like repeat protein [Bradyrhizobium sp. WYCCWR 13022]MDN5002765.1 SEL1-like repeat protein [Bradyrhizobium sp. WYCCWR 12677]